MSDETVPEVDNEVTTPEVNEEKFDVKYSCLRCGTEVSNTELDR